MHYQAYLGIYPESELHQISSTDITVPLGQLVIGTAVRRACPELPVRIFSGEITPEDRILFEVRRIADLAHPVLAGVTLNAGSAKRAMDWAQRLHGLGIDVIIGGPEVWLSYADHGAKLIEDRPYIRAMVIGPGERTVVDIMRYGWSPKLRNALYREIPLGPLRQGEFGSTLLDFSTVEIDYRLLYDIERLCGVSYLWRTDCHLARGKRCYFCGRVEFGSGARDPERVWRELRQARDLWGHTQFYNVADSVAVNEGDLAKFVAATPPDFGPQVHRCFINSHQVSPTTVGLLQRLNGIAAIGLESYDLFHAVGKPPASIQTNERAVALLNAAGVPMVLSFVLGLPGETADTLRGTLTYVKKLVETYKMITGVELSPLTVTSGSQAYRDLMAKVGDDFVARMPPFDVIDLSTRYFEACCNISRSDTIHMIAELAVDLRRIKPDLAIDVKGLARTERETIFPDLSIGRRSRRNPLISTTCPAGTEPWRP